MRAEGVLLICLCACDVPGPLPVVHDLASAHPSLTVSPLTARFDEGADHSTTFDVAGKGFTPDQQEPWDRADPGLFFFLGAAGKLGSLDVNLHRYTFTGQMSGRLTVDLLEPRRRGQSYTLCMSLAPLALDPPTACSMPILFAQ